MRAELSADGIDATCNEDAPVLRLKSMVHRHNIYITEAAPVAAAHHYQFNPTSESHLRLSLNMPSAYKFRDLFDPGDFLSTWTDCGDQVRRARAVVSFTPPFGLGHIHDNVTHTVLVICSDHGERCHYSPPPPPFPPPPPPFRPLLFVLIF